MILVDHAISERVNAGTLQITDFDPAGVQPASYDLRIGELLYAPVQPEKAINIADNGGAYRLPPYGAAILTTLENLKLPVDIIGRIGLKSGFARKGLFASTGPQIDPGFQGKLFISVFNLTAAAHVLKWKDTFLTIEFHTLEERPSNAYSGPYQGKYTVGPEVMESLVRLEGLTLSQMQSQFTQLAKHVEQWSLLAGRFDEFLQKMDGQANAIRDLVSAIGASKNKLNPELANLNTVIRDITAPQAADEILILFRKKKKLYYSDIAEELSLDLRTVIKACELLVKRGLIEGVPDEQKRPKRSRR